jgi:hypothetical protein
MVGAISRSRLLPAGAVAGWGLHYWKAPHFHGAYSSPTSIFMRKRDKLRATLGIQSDRGEPRTKKYSEAGHWRHRAAAGNLASPAISEAATLPCSS